MMTPADDPSSPPSALRSRSASAPARAAATPGGPGRPRAPVPPVRGGRREAFAGHGPGLVGQTRPTEAAAFPCRRVEVGHSEQVRAGVQGCHNDRPFAGFPAGHLRIVRAGSEPGPVRQGVRL